MEIGLVANKQRRTNKYTHGFSSRCDIVEEEWKMPGRKKMPEGMRKIPGKKDDTREERR